MKVLWLSHFVPWPATGHGALQRSHHLLRRLSRRHDVHLLATAPSPHDAPAAIRDATTALNSMVAAVELFPLPRASLPRQALRLGKSCLAGPSYWEQRLANREMLKRTSRIAATVDIVHADSVFLAAYIRETHGTPLVLNHHNIESDLLLRRAHLYRDPVRRWFLLRQAQLVRKAERSLGSAASCNVVVSALDGDRLRSMVHAAHAIEVPNGVDIEFFRRPADANADSKHMVFAGGMDWFPNREAMEFFAAQIWPRLAADDGTRTMTVLGRNPPPGLLRLAASDARVRVLGFVDDVRPYLSRASVYLCPIPVGGGTRLKILDALAMQLPLVSTDLGVEGLELRSEVHFLRANTPDEIVAQVKRLEDSPALGARLGQAGRALVEERYSWERVAGRLDAAWELAASADAEASLSAGP